MSTMEALKKAPITVSFDNDHDWYRLLRARHTPRLDIQMMGRTNVRIDPHPVSRVRTTLQSVHVVAPVLAFALSPIAAPYEAILGGPTAIVNGGTMLPAAPPVTTRMK